MCSFLFLVFENTPNTGFLAPLRIFSLPRFYFALAQVEAASGQVERWNTDLLFPLQGCLLHYLHLLRLLRLHQQLPQQPQAQRCLSRSCPRMWMVWIVEPCSALSRISKRELWGKPKPVITVLLKLADVSCLHWEAKLFCPTPTQVPLPSWVLAQPPSSPFLGRVRQSQYSQSCRHTPRGKHSPSRTKWG